MDLFNFSQEQIETLKEEGIDDESFPLLDEETIKHIFPKAGPRLIFKRKFDEFKEKLHQPQSHPIVLAQVPCSPESPSLSLSSDFVMTDSDTSALIEIIDTEQTYLESPDSEPQISSEPEVSSELEDSNPSCSKRICTTSSLFEDGLERILEKTIDGQIVLLKKENLNNDRRQRLVKEIINYLVGKVGVDGIKSYMLELSACEIQKLFKNETKETYFIGYTKTGPIKRSARGKLWSRFVNVRNALRSAEEKPKSNKVKKSPPKALEKQVELEILSTILEPREKVLELWTDTYQQRRYLLTIRSNLSVQEILDQYAALSTSLGPDLIESDFSSRFDKKFESIYTNVKKVSTAILAEAEARKICVIIAKNIDPVLKALLTLPYLFTPVTLKNKRRSGNWRPSRSEVAESFILQIEKFEDLEQKKAERVEKLKQWNLSLQPFAAICGPLNEVKKYLIIINDVIYTFDSLIRTVDVLYKAFHALDIDYPYESAHVWQFIEEMLYSMKTSGSNSSVSSLISDLNKYM